MSLSLAPIRRFLYLHQGGAILILGACLLAGAELWLHRAPLPPYVADLIFCQGADMAVHRGSRDTKILVELLPGAREEFSRPGKPDRVVSINRLGLRDPERPAKKGPKVTRILMLGSSTAYGAGVSDHETIPVYLEKLLNAQGDGRRYEVWNAGVSSYAPAQMAALGRRLIAGGCDPDVVLFQISLLGPRAFPDGAIRVESYGEDAGLFQEHFAIPAFLPAGMTARIASRSRLVLLLIAHYNRTLDPKERQAWTQDIQMRHHREALVSFMGELGGKVKCATYVVPCERAEDYEDIRSLADAARMPMWCLVPPADRSDYLDAHPPAFVNEYWARVLAEYLFHDKLLAGDP